MQVQAPAKLWATDAGADSAHAKPCAIYYCMMDSASQLLVLLTQALAKLWATDAGADAGSCETLCEMEMYEQFKQSAQALELLHERKMWNEQKPCCLSEASLRFLRMLFHILSEC